MLSLQGKGKGKGEAVTRGYILSTLQRLVFLLCKHFPIFIIIFFFLKKKPVPAKRPQTRPDLPPLVRGVLCWFFFSFLFFFQFWAFEKDF